MPAPNRLLRSPSQVVRPSTVGRIRSLFSDQLRQSNAEPWTTPPRPVSKPATTLQDANPHNLPEAWFNSTFNLSNNPLPQPPPGQPKPPEDTKVKLGQTLRILQDRLPTLLQSPLPQEVLSPNISLHLFPSTHPHLPAVSGRVAYKAALWTSPIAWNRVPVVGNVRLEILSERMVRGRAARRHGALAEQLIVRWRTIGGKGRSNWGLSFLNGGGRGAGAGAGARSAGGDGDGGGGGGMVEGRGGVVGSSQRPGEDKEFTGLFIFEFDREGKILSHTIEHVEEGGQWEQGVGAKVVGLTDWLLGGMKGSREGSDTPCPAFARKER